MEFNTIINTDNYEPNNEMDNEEKSVNLKKKYDYSKKMELVKKIQKIKKTEYMYNIFKIIKSQSQNYNVNNNGVFVFFHDLSDDVYENLENYVNSIYKLHKKSQSNKINIHVSDYSESQIINSILSDTIELENEKELSNKEKVIKRRKNYAKYLDNNQEII
jgi:hypothetical protein